MLRSGEEDTAQQGWKRRLQVTSVMQLLKQADWVKGCYKRVEPLPSGEEVIIPVAVPGSGHTEGRGQLWGCGSEGNVLV